MTIDALQLARERSEREEPFVLATVVWRRAPSSGKQGSKAIIDADGRVSGWLGGACAEPAVVREAVDALRHGEPRLMSLGPPDELGGEKRPGVVTVPIACQSEGALEVYLEPVLPQPRLIAVGRSPAAEALAKMAPALGWDAVLVDAGGSEGDHPGVARLMTSLDLAAAGADEHSFVVVATQGHHDEAALEQAIAAKPAYLGLVASRARAHSIIGYLRDHGAPEEALRRIHAPAGLDLGKVGHEEIAVSILAEIVRLRAAGELPLGASVREPTEHAVDPVCGMAVSAGAESLRVELGGRTHFFCSAGCLEAFEADPQRFAAAAMADTRRG